MNFTHLKAFYTVAKLLSFTKASQELNVSQPTLSLQVQSLEEQYDLVLINRSKKTIEITEEGKLILEYAKKIFSTTQVLENKIQDINLLRSGRLKIGTTPTLGRYLVPGIIQEIKKDQPKLPVELYTDLSRNILNKIIDFEYHVGIIDRVPYPGNIVAKKLFSPPLYFITLDLMKDKIGLKDLSNYPIILLNEGSAIREYIIGEFAKRNIPLNNYLECENPHAIKYMVQLGMGGSFLPWYSIETDVQQGKYRHVEILENLFLNVDLICLKERKKSKPVQIFKSVVEEYSFEGFSVKNNNQTKSD